MTTEIARVSRDIIEEIEERFFDIPFGNSDFQNNRFIKDAQYTPCRGYRALGLKIMSRIKSLNEARFSLKKLGIDVEELEHKISKEKNWLTGNRFQLRRYEIDLEEKQSSLNYTEKLVNDAIHECKMLWKEIIKFPKFTREQFEAEEMEHFKIRLQRQVEGCEGAVDSLDLITVNDGEFDRMLESVKQNLLE